VASSLAIQNALNIDADINDLYIRDLIHGFEFLHNHLRQFYYFTVPDYVKLIDVNPIAPQGYSDFRIPENLSKKIIENYIKNVEYSRLAHEGLAVLGAKAPHNHGIFAGGVTVNMDAYKLEKVKSIISKIQAFVNNSMLEDMKTIAGYYPDYFQKGSSYNNFMSFGLFSDYAETEISFLKPGVMIEGRRYPLEPNNIIENIRYSWHTIENMVEKQGVENVEGVDLKKPDAYSFIKAPRYNGLPMEVGPLARLKLTGEYTGGSSCMDRNMARVLETKKIVDIMGNITDKIQLKTNSQRVYEMPNTAFGAGLVDTIRGTLGHWLQIENKVIKNYDIITPSGWNFSPMDQKGIHGTAEKALIGTIIKDVEKPVELGRIVRSYDPCISCATHIAGRGVKPVEVIIIP
jgi:hydrogenase large subunit